MNLYIFNFNIPGSSCTVRPYVCPAIAQMQEIPESIPKSGRLRYYYEALIKVHYQQYLFTFPQKCWTYLFCFSPQTWCRSPAAIAWYQSPTAGTGSEPDPGPASTQTASSAQATDTSAHFRFCCSSFFRSSQILFSKLQNTVHLNKYQVLSSSTWLPKAQNIMLTPKQLKKKLKKLPPTTSNVEKRSFRLVIFYCIPGSVFHPGAPAPDSNKHMCWIRDPEKPIRDPGSSGRKQRAPDPGFGVASWASGYAKFLFPNNVLMDFCDIA